MLFRDILSVVVLTVVFSTLKKNYFYVNIQGVPKVYFQT